MEIVKEKEGLNLHHILGRVKSWQLKDCSLCANGISRMVGFSPFEVTLSSEHMPNLETEIKQINVSTELKEGEIPLFVTNWMELAIIILSGTEKHVLHEGARSIGN